MNPFPYVRLRPEDVSRHAIRGWVSAPPELVSALGLAPGRSLPLPLAGSPGRGREAGRSQVREGLTTLLALEPSHRDRTLYLEVLLHCDPGFERWLGRRIARAFETGHHAEALREAVAAVNLAPARAEARFNLGLLLSRISSEEPGSPDAQRWVALARGEFARAADLSPELFWGHYHRGVLAYEASLPDAARADWVRFLDRLVADKQAPRGMRLPLLPLPANGAGDDLSGLAYTVLLDVLGLPRPRSQEASALQ